MPVPNYLCGKELTSEQKDIIKAIEKYKVIFIDAKAGSGKTWIATAIAKTLNKRMEYIFAPVLQDVLGALPGNLQAKEEPFLVGLKDALYSIGELPETAIFRVEQKEEPEEEEEPKPKRKQRSKVTNPKYKELSSGEPWVFPSSHVYWRGGNIENSVVVIDEAQNYTKHELKKILTRCHDTCLVFVIGHTEQIDLKRPELSGFEPYLKHSEKTNLATICPLTKNFRGKISTWADSIN
jgi:phosphate starvation-inducible protein PhoH